MVGHQLVSLRALDERNLQQQDRCGKVGVVTGTSMRLGMEGIGLVERVSSGRSSIVDGEGEKRGGEGWCGEKGFWVSGIGGVVGVEGCVDGEGEGGLTGSDSRVETVEGEDGGLEEGDSSACEGDIGRSKVGVRGILSR